jgi:hypothetical protein
MTMNEPAAEVVGLQAAGWLAGNEELLPVFLGSTGATEEDFQQRIEDVEFLGSVLDFLLMDDKWITMFCEDTGIAPEAPYTARMSLPGSAEMHWT